MGLVVAATNLALKQPVALKLLLPEHMQNPQTVERFCREASASAQLRGEHVCRVYDVGVLEDGVPYFVMELLQGADLSTILARAGTLPLNLAVQHVLQACVGVAEAHALGIVHRDLKPANLFLTMRPDGEPLIKVLDFGIAKSSSEPRTSLTRTDVMLGSPAYMSPEQLRSTRSVDVRSDIWSIGVILYELVAGRQPFVGDSFTDLALHIVGDRTPALSGAPKAFCAVIERCLAKDRADRYANLAQLADALAPYAGPRGADLSSAVARLLQLGLPSAGLLAGSEPRAASSERPARTPFHAAASTLARALARVRRRYVLIGIASVAMLGVGVGTAVVAATRGNQVDVTRPSHAPTALTPAPRDVQPVVPAQAPPAAPIEIPPSPRADVGSPTAERRIAPAGHPLPSALRTGGAAAGPPPTARTRPNPPRGRPAAKEDLSESRF